MRLAQIKNDLEAVFNKIKKTSAEGDLPQEEDVKQFVRLCSHMQTYAHEDWAFEADDFLHLAQELLQSVRQEEVQDTIPLIDSLEEAKTYCHRTFRTS
ncbi:GAK system XXXCH domain-containing protein [Desulfovermiculus halophilus]|jgi:XXXCH domain-containing protein|uniref:GAK system XXXCH domain-containing protein n=1 Tax=Desulfovermiculus halophilus TaxID=339722 RepID=UPI000488ABB5|nr:GAK system XXXCH domain-containing protein [Desulfovermiculus halophilus]